MTSLEFLIKLKEGFISTNTDFEKMFIQLEEEIKILDFLKPHIKLTIPQEDVIFSEEFAKVASIDFDNIWIRVDSPEYQILDKLTKNNLKARISTITLKENNKSCII